MKLTKTPRIAMLIPYFGKWPEWMSLYLYTCSRNPQIDFHFFTDCSTPDQTYANTFFHGMTFDEYRAKAKAMTGLDIPAHADKLCDLKPFLGSIHSDILEEGCYQWWGFGDLDVAYGDISQLVAPTLNPRIELVTSHIYQLAGHFCIIKRGSVYDNFQPTDEMKKIVAADPLGFIDEVHYSRAIRPTRMCLIDKLWFAIGLRVKWERNSFYRLMDHILPGKRLNAYYCDPSTTFDPIPGEKYLLDLSTMRWTMGKGHFQGCLRPRSNMPYLHFLKFKKCANNKTDFHWPQDYYKIPANHQWQGNEKVEITLEHIKLV